MLKKLLILVGFIFLTNCTTNENLANCIPTLPLNITTSLRNPELLNANVPGGVAHLTGGNKGILLMNINGTDFMAYDKLCPNGDCEQAMTFEKGIILKCPCDESEYGVGANIPGTPQTPGFPCNAIVYRVVKNGEAIRITNF